jgi:hypothetical protein
VKGALKNMKIESEPLVVDAAGKWKKELVGNSLSPRSRAEKKETLQKSSEHCRTLPDILRDSQR